MMCFFFSSRRRHTRFDCDWSSDVCSSDLDASGSAARGELSTARTEVFRGPGIQGAWRLPAGVAARPVGRGVRQRRVDAAARSEEHTSELQSQSNLVCRLLLEKKNKMRLTRSACNPSIEHTQIVDMPHASIAAYITDILSKPQ